MKDFAGKTAVITGAASGIGRGLAGHAARLGMNVVLADIDSESLRKVESEISAAAKGVLAVRTDVSSLEDIRALARRTTERFGSADLLFNNAGVQSEVQRIKPLWEASLQDWEWVMGVNLRGVIYGIHVFLPIMIKQGTSAHVVNTASQAGLTAGGEMGLYRFSKHGVVSLSETLYYQLKERNLPVGISVLCPALVNSQLNEAERNRPELLRNPVDNTPLTQKQQALKDMFFNANARGLPPAQYAEFVFNAIREDQLYVLESQMFHAAIKQRAEDIVAGRNPTMRK